ncbi:nucleotide-diphospho-sugar transferase [Haematococcus lacustris]
MGAATSSTANSSPELRSINDLCVIIPVLNERENVLKAVQSVLQSGPNAYQPEVVVVDGGSTDGTLELCQALPGVKVLKSSAGRGRQMNVGWRSSQAPWVLFMHGDSQLPPSYPSGLQHALLPAQPAKERGGQQQEAGANWGCFATICTEFDNSWQGWLLRTGVGLRTRLLHQPYGDQALFVSRAWLDKMGGFREWPLLEDLDLVTRLQAAGAGRPAIVELPLQTSGRRWSKLGFWRTALLNQAVLVGWRCGVDVGTLAKWYRAPELLLKPRPKAPAAPSTTTPDPDIASTPALTMTWALTAANLAKPTPWAQPPPLDPPSS